MQLNQAILLLVLFLLLSGCSHQHRYWLEMTPEKQVLDGFDEDQVLRAQLAKLAKGPTVEGSDCAWFVISTSMMEKTKRNAYAVAIGKAGPSYDALINVMQTSTSYSPFRYCVSLKGTAVKNKTFHATRK